MKSIRILVVSLVCGSIATAASAQNWPDTSKMNKWFDDRQGKQYNVNQAGEIQKPGTFQPPGKEIPIPKGWDAVKVVKTNCQEKLLICADTLFEFDKSTLTPYAEATLKLLAPKIAALGAHPVRVEGHTDSKGDDAYNQNLSERRAERVRNWLMQNHCIPVSSEIEGFGEKKPVAPNMMPDGKTDNPKGRQQNRRVEIVVNTCVSLDQSTHSAAPVSVDVRSTSPSSPAFIDPPVPSTAPSAPAFIDPPVPSSAPSVAPANQDPAVQP